MTDERAERALLAAGAAGVATLLALTVPIFLYSPEAAGFAIPFSGAFVAGALAQRAAPANRAARRLLALGALAPWWTAGNFALILAYRSQGDDPSLALPNTALLGLDGIFAVSLLGVLYTFPEGGLRRAYERRILRTGYALALAIPVLALLSATPAISASVFLWNEPELGVARIDNPFALPALAWLEGPLSSAQALLPAAAVLGAVSLVARYRATPASRRRRFKWLLVAVIALAASPIVGLIVENLELIPRPVGSVVVIVLLTAIPVLLAIAIARPNLFDVDLVLRRALVYGTLWLGIAGAYVGVAAALGLAAGSVGIQLAVAVTLVTTLLLGPVFGRFQRLAARRVYGERERLRLSLGEERRRAEALAASRARIVEAEEAARRRIERDIHDGVQQELVALIAKIGLARTQLARDPALVEATLGDLQLEAQQAVADLRELARGIHPSVLSDRGVVEAIEARAARLPLGVTIECAPGLRSRRFEETVEGAVYFIVCEGFGNALKHSGAERVFVRLRHEPGELRVEVSDDGRGFDPARIARSGLDGLADRVEALGGDFEVRAAPGAGTTIVGRLRVDEVVAV